MSKLELEEYFKSSDIKAFTPNTITDLNILKEHLMIVARDGIAYDDEELFAGVKSVAAGIKDSQGKTFCCLGVLGPTLRLTQSKITEIASVLKQYTSYISREIR